MEPPSAPPDPLHDFQYGSFGGVTCAQLPCDFLLWESVLNSNPQLQGIVEIGTWQGGFSRYLRAQARERQIGFVTFDVIAPDREVLGFVKLDVFRHQEAVGLVIDEMGPCALFCDGGNKPRELQVFPPMLPVGSIVLVHDWGTETMPQDVPETLEELYGDFCDSIGSITRVFRFKP